MDPSNFVPPFSFANNQLDPLPVSPTPPASSAGHTATAAIAGGVAARLFAAPAIVLAWWRRRKPWHNFFARPAEIPEVHLGQLTRFSLRELRVATDNFNNQHVLWRLGCLGKVYKGRLADGSLVAVKRIGQDRRQGVHLKFEKEVELITTAVHRNLLWLHGFCMTKTEHLLVYGYMANGSVASYFKERRDPPLDWLIRKRIALGAARGLSYLHDRCPRIIHRDVKSANIFLDEDFDVVVGGFELAFLMDYNDTDVTTAVCGTLGHIPPEYLTTGKVSEKTDVYGYGVTLLELISAKKAFDLGRIANDEDVMLLDWVKETLQKKTLEMLVDANLQGNYVDEEVEKLIQIALLCTRESPMERPSMSDVVRMLEGDCLAAERWKDWKEEEMSRQEFNHNLRPEELFDPRRS